MKADRPVHPDATTTGLPWAIVACITATFFLRSGSFAAGVLQGIHLGRLTAAGVAVDAGTIGLLSATFFTVEVIGAPLFGTLGDRIGHRPFLLAGPIAGAIAAQFLGLTTLVPLLMLVMAFKGLSAATSIPSTLAYLSYGTRGDEANRTRAVAWFEVANVAGIGLGGALGGFFWGWFGTWAFTAVAGLYVIALLLLLTIGPAEIPTGTSHHRGLGDYARLVRQPRLLRFIPAWVSVNAIVGLWIQHAPYALSRPKTTDQLLQGGYSGDTVGTVFAGVGMIVMVGIVLWGNLLAGRPRISGMYVGLAGLTLLTVFLGILNHSGQTWGPGQIALLVLAGGAGLIAAGFTPAALTYLSDIAEEHGEDRGAVMGLYSVFFGVGQVTGALVGGPLAVAFATDGLILLTGVLTLIGFFSVQVLRGDTPRRATASG
ncbi:MAG TPA: MFS transporter [Dehalococcoidia bacterium]|nr:MFS transporter [Dehalococcoidia bacterium]